MVKTPVSQASETTVSVEPIESSANVGEKFAVNFTIWSVQNLYGVGLTLKWNTSILGLEVFDVRFGESDGVLFNPIYIAENLTVDGSYYLSATSTNPAPSFNGNGNIAKLTFRVLALGETKIDIQTQLYDYPPPDRDPRTSLPIVHTTIDGIFSGIIPEFPNAAIFLVFFILVFLLTLWVKKTSRMRTTKNLLVDSCVLTLKLHINQSRGCHDRKVGGYVGWLA
jgi:hypothetical protein